MELILNDAVKFSLNSLVEGIIDRSTAIGIIEDAVNTRCAECIEKTNNSQVACLMTLERAMDEGVEGMFDIENDYPLDTIEYDTADILHRQKGMILHCEDGHVLGIYHERVESNIDYMEVEYYGEGKRASCI